MTQHAELHDSEVARAQWHVRTILQRLDCHRMILARDEQWHAREADHLLRLRCAHEELDRARRSPAAEPATR